MNRSAEPRITWVNFLHIYQPPWQDPEMVRQVTEESYSFLIRSFKTHPSFRATLNIAGTLLETLQELGYDRLISDLQQLVARGQIELAGSSQFHAFLPQLPEDEIRRQIDLQEKTLAKFFPAYTRRGFFLPEMAYSSRVGLIIKDLHFKWVILDPISTREKPGPEIKHLDRRTGLTVVFRNRQFSRTYPPEEIFKLRESGKRQTIITATDGELYGHFHKDWQAHLKQILESKRITSRQISEYLAGLSASEPIRLRSASWETRAHQIKRNNPFSIWYNRSNPIHKRLWQLAHLAMELIRRHRGDPNYAWARRHLDRGLASCSWWWASEIKTSPFAPIAWSPDEVQKGALELIKSIRSLEKVPADEKIRAEKIYLALLEAAWTKHWKTYGRTR